MHSFSGQLKMRFIERLRSKVREDITLARMIGEYWMEITEGKGIYFNCNAQKDSYRDIGIGMINHNDMELRNNLNKTVGYLAKVDHYARMITPDGQRTFGRGEIMTKEKSMGRPRKKVTSSLI